MSSLRKLLAHKLKSKKPKVNHGGFTLIELLVAMIVAVLIIAPLLRFMITIVDTDRKEQAKATSEQEIQAAMDYIARDLEQAVYIYDASGVERDNAGTADDSGIQDQIPPVAAAPGCNTNNCQPVLVFWKRKYFDREDTVGGTRIGDFTNENDTFVYALVAYYLITEENDKWSNIARIGRFEVYDKIIDATSNKVNKVGIPASPGFKSFDLSKKGNSLKEKLNQWTKEDAPYTTQAQILVDYIDNKATAITPDCPNNYLLVPSEPNGGFYACVDAEKRIAQLFLIGNALARLKNNPNDYEYKPNRSSYFPTVTMQIEGRGFLGL
ncbi:MAG: prepilin-type N-terminal cleavage/methylation domain-containing protein [Moorea sp. SIO2B7]|nr:prepilin-type N-terminal cleavage/methylation domain-containing protein [Moorena sp. SIO2B7]